MVFGFGNDWRNDKYGSEEWFSMHEQIEFLDLVIDELKSMRKHMNDNGEGTKNDVEYLIDEIHRMMRQIGVNGEWRR